MNGPSCPDPGVGGSAYGSGNLAKLTIAHFAEEGSQFWWAIPARWDLRKSYSLPRQYLQETGFPRPGWPFRP